MLLLYSECHKGISPLNGRAKVLFMLICRTKPEYFEHPNQHDGGAVFQTPMIHHEGEFFGMIFCFIFCITK